MIKTVIVALALSVGVLCGAFVAPAAAQTTGGNATLAVTSSTGNVALPASNASYPFVVVTPAAANTADVWVNLGTSNAVTAANTNRHLPAGGACFTVGPNTWLAAIGSASTTIYVDQVTQCYPVL